MAARVMVSIIIVNWNGARFLEGCLSSVQRQTERSFEVIFVDNGSTDASVDFVSKRFPGVVIIRNAVNLGFAAANNQGIRMAAGKYILTLNNDTEMDASFLGEITGLAEAATDDKVGMWAPKILSMSDRTVIDSVGGLLIYPDALARGRGRLERDTGQYDGSVEVFIPSACAALYRKSMLDEVGLFDEDFFAYCEDTDLGLRARLAGYRAESAPGAVVYHFYSGTSGGYSPLKAYLVERNHLWAAIKNLPLSVLAFCPFYVAWRYCVQAYGIISGKGSGGRFVEGFSKSRLIFVLLKAYIDIVRGLPRMLSRRAAIQRGRRVSASDVRGWFKRYGISAAELVLKD